MIYYHDNSIFSCVRIAHEPVTIHTVCSHISPASAATKKVEISKARKRSVEWTKRNEFDQAPAHRFSRHLAAGPAPKLP